MSNLDFFFSRPVLKFSVLAYVRAFGSHEPLSFAIFIYFYFFNSRII